MTVVCSCILYLACEQPSNDSSMYVYFVVWLVNSPVMTMVCMLTWDDEYGIATASYTASYTERRVNDLILSQG